MSNPITQFANILSSDVQWIAQAIKSSGMRTAILAISLVSLCATVLAVAKLGMIGLILGLAGACVLLVTALIFAFPWFGVAAIAFVLPFERLGSIELAGFTFRPSQGFLIITIVAFMLHCIFGRVKIRFSGAIIPLFLVVIGALAAIPGAINSFRAYTSAAFIIFCLLLVIVLPSLLTDRNKLLFVLKAFFLGAIITSCFGLFQFAGDLAGLPPEITGLREIYTKEVFGFPRIQSTALEPLYYANYLLLPLALSVVVVIKRIRQLLPYALLFLPVALPVFVLTLSRAAYIAAAAMFLVLIAAVFRRHIKPTHVILFIFVAIFTLVAVTYALSLTGEGDVSAQAFIQQATNLFSGASFTERVQTTDQSWELFKQHPWGIGPGNFGPSVADNPFDEPEDGWLIVNNMYLEVATEDGIIGISGLLAFLAFLVFALLRSYHRRPDLLAGGITIAVAAASIGICVQFLTFSTLYIMHVWFVFALGVTCLHLFKEEANGN